ncbi:MAG: AAA family ATPase [Methylococcales bacterium]|nr:AAA family ATPase [Methylococcales bacterium]
MITEIKVENYKSLQDFKMEVGRFNVLIGENGCGKSNILEAITLAGAAEANKLDKEFLFSGWRNLLIYLESDIFREDVENFEFMVIQVDTDVSNDGNEHFNVPHYDSDNRALSTKTLINNVTEKLISTIDKNDTGFYPYYSERIIFAVSVHSIECWLVAHYSEQVETQECFKVLGTIKLPKKIPVTKKHNGRNYHRLSEPFLDRKNIDLVAKKNISFKAFIDKLPEL